MTHRLPIPGQDDGVWGDILNDYLGQAHNSDGTLKPQAVTDAGAYTKPTLGIPVGDLTSSVQTSLTTAVHQDNLVMNVKDHGAKGDGAADDAAAIQAVLNTAAASGTGNVVFFPAGMYRIGTKLTVPSGTVLRGVSAGTFPGNNSINQVSVLARTVGMNDHVLYLPAGNSYVHIQDLAIDGNKNNNTSGSGLYIADDTSGTESQVIVERCYFHDNPDSNVYLGHYRRANKLIRSVFNYSGSGDGVTVAGSDNSIESCIFGTNGRCGVSIGSTTSQNFTISGGNAATMTHVSNCDIYGNQVGIAVTQFTSLTMITNNGIDRNTKHGITVYDGNSAAIIGNSLHSNGTGTDNTYAHIDVGASVSAVVIDDNLFGALDSGITNRASYGVNVPSTSNRVAGNMGTYDATSAAGGLTNASSNAQPWVTLSSAGATIQSSGNDILNLRNSSGSLVTKLTNGGSFVHSGGGVQFSVNSNHVFGASSPIGSGANLLSLKTSSATIANMATQNTSGQTAPNIISYASDGTTPIFQVDKGGAVSVTGMTGATAASRYVGATAGGSPSNGTFAVGDFAIDQTGKIWVCTAAGTPGTWSQVSGGAAAGSGPNMYQQLYGYLGWAFDQASVSGGTALGAAGAVTLIKLPWTVTASVTNIIVSLSAGGTLTAGQCFAGLYNSSGSLLGTTADQSGIWNSAGTAPKTMTISGGPVSVPSTGGSDFVYVALLWNGSAAPSLHKAVNATTANFNGALTAATLRCAVNGSGNTSLPTLLTLSSSTNATNLFWAAVS